MILSGILAGPSLQAQDDLGVGLRVGPGTEIPLFLEVFLNGRPTNLIAEFTLDTATGLMSSPRSELREVGVEPPRGLSRNIALNAIEGLTYDYNPERQTIALTVDPGAQRVQVISANRAEPPVRPEKSWGAVLNYDASMGINAEDVNNPQTQRLNVSTDGWLFSPFGILSNQTVFGLRTDGESDVTRLETTFQYDFVDPAITFSAGDVVSSSLAWSRPLRLGGLQIRREFGLRNDIVTEPLLSFDGAAALPTTVDVFIDNNRVYGGQINQGPYRVEDVPIYSGAGDALVILRDSNGRESRSNVPFFASRTLLKSGVADYAIEAGFPREGYGQTSADYADDPVASGSVRYGITDRLTAELHFEASEDLRLWGGGLNAVIANRAELTFATGQSTYEQTTATFTFGTLRTQFGNVSMQGSLLRADAGFADLAQVTAVDFLTDASDSDAASLLKFPNTQDVLSIGFPIGDGTDSLGASYVRSVRGDTSDEIASLNLSKALDWREANLNLRASYDLVQDDRRLAGYLTFDYGDMNVQLGAEHGDADGTGLSVNVFRQLDEAPGSIGYRAGLDYRERETALAAAVAARTAFGRGEVAIRNSGDNTVLQGRFQGALAMAGTSIAAGGRVNDGFAIVDVGVPDVPISLQNRPVATSGPGGRALVGGLTSFGNNRISVDPTDVPMDATLGSTATNITPARRSGLVVDFGGTPSDNTATVILVDERGAHLPVGSEVVVNGNGRDSFVVGFDGVAFLTDLGETNALTVNTGTWQCGLTLPRLSGPGQHGPFACR